MKDIKQEQKGIEKRGSPGEGPRNTICLHQFERNARRLQQLKC